jgi:D-alanine-D-alanine ligase
MVNTETQIGWAAVDSLVARLRARVGEIAIAVVANRKQQVATDYDGYSVQTEYFSDEELEQIVGAMRALGLYVKTYFSEDDFIEAVLHDQVSALPRAFKLVYNSAQTGVGPGRKALIPSFCRLHNIATSGSDAYVVSLARHKYHTACILRAAGVPVPGTWCYIPRRGWLNDARPPEGTRVIVKLTYESASIGMDGDSLRPSNANLEEFVETIAGRYDQPLTIQEFISGYEVETPVIGLAQPFSPMAVGISIDGSRDLGDEFLTYQRVFTDDYGFYSYDDSVASAISNAARTAFDALGIRGFGRIDFRIDDSGCFYVIDVATNPHVIEHSSFAYLFRATDRPYSHLIALLLALACDREGWI